MTRRELLSASAASAATLAFPQVLRSASSAVDSAADTDAIQAEIVKRHAEGVARLQEWIKQPSIAAEKRGMEEGCALMMRFAREAGFQQVTRVPTDGQPGVFATLDAGAPKTIGLYFMYDVKQVDPSEWSSPPCGTRRWSTSPASAR
jgi:acetylornithine deacetylase/succinyl-diaminopimelate desuccinylase-like protein